MSKIGADELRLIAFHGFQKRLEAVIVATISYQTAKKAYAHSLSEHEAAMQASAVARELEAQLPAALNLPALVYAHEADTYRKIAEARTRLSVAADEFFECAGTAAAGIVTAMEAADWQLTRGSLIETLREPLSAY